MQLKLIQDSIQIGGHTYKIILRDAASVDDAGHNQGDSCPSNVEIRAGLKLMDGTYRALSSLEHTLWHEILHQIDRVYAGKDLLGEEDVERLSQGLYQIFKQFGWHIAKED